MSDSPLLDAVILAHEGNATEAVKAIAEEHERMAERYLDLIENGHNSLSIESPAEVDYYKGRLDEARSAAMTARQVWLALESLEVDDGE